MNILLIGSGGREHALAWKISSSPLCKKLYISPGNAGTSECGINIPIAVSDFVSLKNFIIEKNISLVVVGPEEPLVNGIRDFLESNNETKDVLVFGPGKSGARLEGSKDFAKAFMVKYAIPTAASKTFTRESIDDAHAFLQTMKAPYVLKADGLAAGKGVLIVQELNEAKSALHQLMNEAAFGAAGEKVVIEEYLDGIELSVFVLTDGVSYITLPEAKDYKRVGDGDMGPNTGGMGAVSPVPFSNELFRRKVDERIIRPTIEGLKKEGIDYKGVLFIGLMNVAGDPFVIEYNVRFGDPETEVVIPRIKTDVVELFSSVASGKLKQDVLQTDPRFALTVMLVSGGYPGSYKKGKLISGLDKLQTCQLFHAGTRKSDSEVLTDGGRVMTLTAMSDSITGAREKVYAEIAKLNFDEMYFRKDIGVDLMEK